MSGWQLSPEAAVNYAKYGPVLMNPWTNDLIISAKCQGRDRVLDLACGTGTVANQIRNMHPGCRVTGTDVNEGMLAVARQNTAIEWQQSDAASLPFPDGSFDVITCQQGLQYFSDRAAAMKEMARVLVPGGRIAVNVWGAMWRNPFIQVLNDEVRSLMGDDAIRPLTMAFSLNRPDMLRELAGNAGFISIHVRLAHKTARFPDIREFIGGFMSISPMAGQFQALLEGDREYFIDRVANRLQDCMDDDGMAVPQENQFLTATR